MQLIRQSPLNSGGYLVLPNQLQKGIYIREVFNRMLGTAFLTDTHKVKLKCGCRLEIPQPISNESDWSVWG